MAGNLTLALIKPHIVRERNIGKVIARIEDAGFSILMLKMLQFRKEGVEEFYKEHLGKDFFKSLSASMINGPLLALVLAKNNAVEEWRLLIGSTAPAEATEGTLRKDFGHPGNVSLNAVHGSLSDHDAIREINFFFGRDLKLGLSILEAEEKENK